MNYKVIFLFIILICCGSVEGHQQPTLVEFVVTNIFDSQPMQDVSIILNTTQLMTDSNGYASHIMINFINNSLIQCYISHVVYNVSVFYETYVLISGATIMLQLNFYNSVVPTTPITTVPTDIGASANITHQSTGGPESEPVLNMDIVYGGLFIIGIGVMIFVGSKL